jgi:hypothetical protein
MRKLILVILLFLFFLNGYSSIIVNTGDITNNNPTIYQNTNRVKAIYQGENLVYNPEKKNFIKYSGIVYAPESDFTYTVADYAFYACSEMTGYYFYGNVPETVGTGIFGSNIAPLIYRRAEATGWPEVPNTFSGLTTAIWTSYPDPMP